MLDLFEKHGKANKSNYTFQYWQHENHPILLDNLEMYNQRLVYLHENPVRAGL
jgi:putative transposase